MGTFAASLSPPLQALLAEIAGGVLLAAAAAGMIYRERSRGRREVMLAQADQRLILDHIPEAVVVFNAAFEVIEWNAAASRLYGISRSEAIGARFPTAPVERWNELRTLIERIEANQPVLDYESERVDARGVRIPVALSYARMPADTGAHYLEIAQDIRERLRLRDKLIEMEKLTLMGRMAAGIAHHLNTPLTAMLLEAEMLGAQTGEGDGEGEAVVIKERVRYCQSFVQQLLSFSRTSDLRRKPFLLSEAIRAAAAMLQPTVAMKKASVEIEWEGIEGGRALIDPNHFEAAFSALLSNAIDAVPVGGAVRVHGVVAGGHAEIYIDDDGPGVPSDMMSVIFEPFFTTKPSGHGTGLGLPIARNIVERHGGELSLDPRKGGGIRAHLRLPLLAAVEGEVAGEPEAGR